ncbi:hypothetical protein [Niallia circulans]|uniref:hypothetical protein n=1 Tax=Niallia circulans TaxID=1397 RepID=UPI0035246136
MAYLKAIDYNGLIIENAYHRIDVTSSADGKCKATLNIYASRDAYKAGKGYLIQEIINYPIDYGAKSGADKNQGYEFLLSLEENKDAISVFEEGQPD